MYERMNLCQIYREADRRGLGDAGLCGERRGLAVQVSQGALRTGAQPLGGADNWALHHECLAAASHGLLP